MSLINLYFIIRSATVVELNEGEALTSINYGTVHVLTLLTNWIFDLTYLVLRDLNRGFLKASLIGFFFGLKYSDRIF